MIFAFLFWNLGSSAASGGATKPAIWIPILWAFISGVYAVFFKWKNRNDTIDQSWNRATGRTLFRPIASAATTVFLLTLAMNLCAYFGARLIVESKGTTKIIYVLIAAYLVAGLHYVLRDLAKPTINQPAYVRASGSLPSKVLGGLMWLPATVLNFPMAGWRWKYLKDPIVSLLIFVLIVWLGLVS